MTSTVTNYSNLINTLFPVAGVDNDTQGFRDNFENIQNAFTNTANEITNLQNSVQVIQNNPIINSTSTVGLTVIGTITATNYIGNGSQITDVVNVGTLTNGLTVIGTITATNFVGDGSQITDVVNVGTLTNGLTVIGTVAATNFVGDGSQLTNLAFPNFQNVSVTGNITANGNITGTFIGDGHQITNITNVGPLTNLHVNGTITATNFVGDGSQLINLNFNVLDVAGSNNVYVQNINVNESITVGQNIGVTGNATAAFFIGDGSGLTNIKLGVVPSLNISGTATINQLYADTIILSSGTFVSPNINSTGTITANGIQAQTVQSSSFVGNGAELTNLTIPNYLTLTELTSTNIVILNNLLITSNNTTSTISINNNNLTVTGVKAINVYSTITTTATYFSHGPYQGQIGFESTLTFTNADTVNIGTGTNQFNQFRLGDNDTLHTILSTSNVGNTLTVTTTAFDPDTLTPGINTGSIVTFYKTVSPVVSLYVPSAPIHSYGAPGDVAGMTYASSTTLYVCYSNYVNSSTNIWSTVALNNSTF